MEKVTETEQRSLLMNAELKQGQELANQLRHHFLDTTQQSKQTCDALLAHILSSYEKSLSILQSDDASLSLQHHSHSFTSDSTPTSDISDEPHKKRGQKAALPQWSEQVQVPPGTTGPEAPLADGYIWRKYGQKDILGATFSRAYCRYTYHHSQGCLATKQVQRSDEDSSLLHVTYKGRHTCSTQGSELSAGLVSFGKQEKRQKKASHEPKQDEQPQAQKLERIISFGTSLTTEQLGTSMQVERLPSLSFPCTIEESVYDKDYLFSENTRENNFMGSSYSSYMTPETSEGSYMSYNFGIAQNLQSSESDLTEQILSAPNSVTNSSIGDFDISLDPVDFDLDIPLDILEFFK